MILKHNTNKYFYLTLKKMIFGFPFNPGYLLKAFSVLIIILKGEKLRLRSQKQKSIPIPYACILSITWKCNLKCSGCYAQNYPSENQLKINEIKSILKQTDSLGTYIFVIVGGEPLLYPEILNILSDSKNTLFFLFTNGTLLNTRKLSIIKKSKNIIPIISTEGNMEFTDSRRGQGTGNKVNIALSLLKEHKIIFGFSSMITHQNIKHVLSENHLDSL